MVRSNNLAIAQKHSAETQIMPAETFLFLQEGLQRHFQQAQQCEPVLLIGYTKRLLQWLHSNYLFSDLLAHLESKLGTQKESIDSILSRTAKFHQNQRRDDLNQLNSEELAAACHYILTKISEFDAHWQLSTNLEITNGLASYLGEPFRYSPSLQTLADGIQKTALPSLYSYLLEVLESHDYISTVLDRYKTKVEWFEKDLLYQIVLEEEERSSEPNQKSRVEKRLISHAQKYLFDQGLGYSIEEDSASGTSDLVLTTLEGNRVPLDAKYIPPCSPSKIRGKLAKGLHQVYSYARDYNSLSGYLLLFSNLEQRLGIEIEAIGKSQYFMFGDKRIHIVEVNIRKGVTASQLKKADFLKFSRKGLIQEAEVSL